MKLEKAIEILTKMEKTLEPTMTLSGIEAMELLIEAGKREMECRENAPHEDWLLLPGETED